MRQVSTTSVKTTGVKLVFLFCFVYFTILLLLCEIVFIATLLRAHIICQHRASFCNIVTPIIGRKHYSLFVLLVVACGGRLGYPIRTLPPQL
jgi:hypothetical protein